MSAPRILLAAALAAALMAAGCGSRDTQSPRTPAAVEVTPTTTLLTAPGDTVRFRARVVDQAGATLPGAVTWSSLDPGVATVDAGGLVTAVSHGTAEIRAASGDAPGVAGGALLEVWIPPTVEVFVPGVSYAGRRGYVEYIPGTLPLILAAPHGGALTPAEIPDRTWGTTVTDSHTEPLARELADALMALTGERPHLVISHLRRTKLDPNREAVEAAQGNVFAEWAWTEFHGFIEAARDAVTAAHGSALFLDLHGHGHAVQRVELGYLLSAADLGLPDGELDALASRSSIAALAASSGTALSALVRGEWSLGGLMMAGGIPAVPSPGDPAPGPDPYFSGGYSTAVHGSRDGGSVSAIQLEHHFTGLRDTQANREAYAGAMAGVLRAWLERHLGFPPAPPLFTGAAVGEF